MSLPAIPEYRVPIKPGTAHNLFPEFEDIPGGCFPFMVPDWRHAPFLERGQYAIVDTGDRELTLGELYRIRQDTDFVLWQVVRFKRQTTSGKPCVMLRPLAGIYPTSEALDAAIRSGRAYLSDGPVHEDYIRSRIVGRVIGVLAGYRAAPSESPF